MWSLQMLECRVIQISSVEVRTACMRKSKNEGSVEGPGS